MRQLKTRGRYGGLVLKRTANGAKFLFKKSEIANYKKSCRSRSWIPPECWFNHLQLVFFQERYVIKPFGNFLLRGLAPGNLPKIPTGLPASWLNRTAITECNGNDIGVCRHFKITLKGQRSEQKKRPTITKGFHRFCLQNNTIGIQGMKVNR